jgi:uncharacterized protein YraI
MIRKICLIMLAAGLILATALPVTAQEAPNAWTAYNLNMRSGPSAEYDIVMAFPVGTGLILEARNDDISWLLVHTEDGRFRGWVSSLYLDYAPGVRTSNLAVSAEIVGSTPPPAEAAPATEQQAAPAPGSVTAYTTFNMNIRSGPGTIHRVIGSLPIGAGLVTEARSGDASWILAHTENGAKRGWVYSQYLRFVGADAAALPVSEELIGEAPAASAGTETVSEPAPVTSTSNPSYQGIVMGPYDPSLVNWIDLTSYPVVAVPTGRSRSIFLQGQSLGNNRNVMAKVGDCSSEHWYFLNPFAWGQYDLGDHADLQPVIDHFGESLAYNSQAAHNGYNANVVIAPEWGDPSACAAGESPLKCEYRIHKPSVAVIMFGTSDLLVMSAYEFDFYMRDIVEQSIEAGVIPVLSTFPGNQGFPNHTILFNQIVVRIAMDYDIPLINLWLALERIPNQGLEADGFHLGEPIAGESGILVGDNLQRGYPTRNLVTLQSLDVIWRSSMQ